MSTLRLILHTLGPDEPFQPQTRYVLTSEWPCRLEQLIGPNGERGTDWFNFWKTGWYPSEEDPIGTTIVIRPEKENLKTGHYRPPRLVIKGSDPVGPYILLLDATKRAGCWFDPEHMPHILSSDMTEAQGPADTQVESWSPCALASR